VALKSSQDQGKGEDVEELLDALDKTLDRLKVLYEQYFLGMQKQAPAYIHNDVERKLRDLAQLNIRNTGLRYRLATLQQKFGAYNSYWRRTLRQIEQGTYVRNLSKIGRQAARTGEEIPEEILAAMPKRMREQVLKDRDVALAAQARRKRSAPVEAIEPEEGVMYADEPGDDEETPAIIGEAMSTELRRELKTKTGAFVLGDDEDIDIDAFFASVEQEKAPAVVPAEKPVPPVRQSQPVIPTQPIARQSSPAIPTQPVARQSSPAIPTSAIPKVVPPTGAIPKIPGPPTGAIPKIPGPPTGAIPKPGVTGAIPRAPSQAVRPNPIAPGSAAAKGPVAVEQMAGPFPRAPGAPAPQAPAPRPEQPKPPQPTHRLPRTQPGPVEKPPPGMSDADVNALYAKYVQAKQMVGEQVGPGGYGKLLKTINAQAPKIMEQYKAKAVDFSVVVKDNQVIIKAKPKL
jgi:hypothetical protein